LNNENNTWYNSKLEGVYNEQYIYIYKKICGDGPEVSNRGVID